MCDRKRTCCNCDHRIADINHCDVDGAYINYSQCFEHWCRKWSGKEYRKLFDEEGVRKSIRGVKQ